MSSVARHHAEWLSLIEVSGPFLSMPVLLRVFPQGLDELDKDQRQVFRESYDEWLDRGAKKAAAHRAWVLHVLTELLGHPAALLAEGQAMPPGLEAIMALHGETLRPDFALLARNGGEGAATPSFVASFVVNSVDKAHDKARDKGAEASRGGNPKPSLLVSMYPPDQDLDKPLPGKVWKACPGTRMMELLHATDIPVGLVTNGERWMLVYAPRQETTGFASWYADLWTQEPITLRAFVSLLHLRRLLGVAAGDTLAAILHESAKDQQEVTDQLGYQVRQAVEVLVQAFDRLDADSGRNLLAGVDEKTLYDSALTVMMRLVFMFAAEERGMLLLGQNPLYDEYYALSALRDELRERADQQGEEVLERRHDAWCRLLATFRAVHGGVEHETMRLPAYGGTLFDPDRYTFLEGRAAQTKWSETPAKPLGINNRVVLHLLEALQVLRVRVPGGGPAEARRISFRALDIEQIGHVYEGLLDHTAKRAGEVVLGLAGAKNKEPEIPLTKLEALAGIDGSKILQLSADEEPERLAAERADSVPVPGEKKPAVYGEPSPDLVAFLKEETGRSESAIARALRRGHEVDHHKLSLACGRDFRLEARVGPFAGLLREDSFGQLVVIPEGSVYVTRGSDRRSTGTHYTPRSLTEPIVEHTLEPLVYVGPAEGKPESEWQLKSPKEILDLKVCDMAMGSGAFLVQACRYLSERLVEAWEERQKAEGSRIKGDQDASDFGLHPSSFILSPLALPGATPSTGSPQERLLPLDDAERLAVARRAVADRCLYGVDINPMAVEMAKLSLWLVTLQKDRPFTFLDHALKCGDSLLGVSKLEQIDNFRLRPGVTQHTFATINLFRYAEESAAKRRALETLPSETHDQLEQKQRLHAEAEAATEKVEAIADLLVALQLRGLGTREHEKARETETERIQGLLRQDADANASGERSHLVQAGRDGLAERRTFHWPLEFPEVFVSGGFSAFVGNPPFMHGSRISTRLGERYFGVLKKLYPTTHGQADLCGLFLVRAFALVGVGGCLGLITTNTISQGDTRVSGLGAVIDAGGVVIRAQDAIRWPGSAAVTVSLVHVCRGNYQTLPLLNGRSVRSIDSFLEEGDQVGEAHILVQNAGKSHAGSHIYGTGFTVSPEQAAELIQRDPKNRAVLFPFLRGDDVLTRPDQSPSRWVINFFDWPLTRAEEFPDCIGIVRQMVKPERDQVKRRVYRENWWQFAEQQRNLYRAIDGLERALFHPFTSKYLCFVFVPTTYVFATPHVVIALSGYAEFVTLQSAIHETWVRHAGSTLGSTLRYPPTDCFQKFPFPPISPVESCGERYHTLRRRVAIENGLGLTDVCNRFHDRAEAAADIAQLRALHVEMDQAVAAAYGWTDLDLGHGFHETKQGIRYTISESARRTVLDRLLALNHERYEEEVKAGLHEKKAKGRRLKAEGKRKKAGMVREDAAEYGSAQPELGL